MDLMAFLPSAQSNSMIDGNQIAFATIDFRPRTPTLVLVFASLDRAIDVMFGSFNFASGP
jgi:hypothetical protein